MFRTRQALDVNTHVTSWVRPNRPMTEDDRSGDPICRCGTVYAFIPLKIDHSQSIFPCRMTWRYLFALTYKAHEWLGTLRTYSCVITAQYGNCGVASIDWFQSTWACRQSLWGCQSAGPFEWSQIWMYMSRAAVLNARVASALAWASRAAVHFTAEPRKSATPLLVPQQSIFHGINKYF